VDNKISPQYCSLLPEIPLREELSGKEHTTPLADIMEDHIDKLAILIKDEVKEFK
jgi:hypothetical protein